MSCIRSCYEKDSPNFGHEDCGTCIHGDRPPQQKQEPVSFITPLMEQQLFDDWCPYKGNPDPRTAWTAAIDAVNGLLLGVSPPQRQPLTDEEITALLVELCVPKGYEGVTETFTAVVRAIEAAHGITGEQK